MKIFNSENFQGLLNFISLLLVKEAGSSKCPHLSASDTSGQGVEAICKYQDVSYDCYRENLPVNSVVYFKCKSPILPRNTWNVHPHLMMCMGNGTWAPFFAMFSGGLNCSSRTEENVLQKYEPPIGKSHFKLRSIPWRNDEYYYYQEPETSLPFVPSTASTTQVSDPWTSEEIKSTSRSMNEMINQIVRYINAYRTKHGARHVTLNRKVSQEAQHDARVIINTVDLVLGQNAEYGQTLFELSKSGEEVTEDDITRKAVDTWYESKSEYDPDNPRPLAFTQLVWKRSKWVGCGIETRGERTVVLCNFYPAGNIEVSDTEDRWREYRRNVRI